MTLYAFTTSTTRLSFLSGWVCHTKQLTYITYLSICIWTILDITQAYFDRALAFDRIHIYRHASLNSAMPESKAADIASRDGDTTKSSTTQSAIQQTSVSDLPKEGKEESTKKMGFFEKWRAKTAAGYEKHRAAGGNF